MAVVVGNNHNIRFCMKCVGQAAAMGKSLNPKGQAWLHKASMDDGKSDNDPKLKILKIFKNGQPPIS